MKNTTVRVYDQSGKLLGTETLAYLFENCDGGYLHSGNIRGYTRDMRIEIVK